MLNDDCLIHIFSYLPLTQLIPLSALNSHTHKLINTTQTLWSDVEIYGPIHQACKTIKKLCEKSRFIRGVYIRDVRGLHGNQFASTLLALFSTTPGLTSLRISELNQPILFGNDAFFAGVMERCRLVERIEFENGPENTNTSNALMRGLTLMYPDLRAYTDHQAYGPTRTSLRFICSWKSLRKIDLCTEMMGVEAFGVFIGRFRGLERVGFTRFREPLKVAFMGLKKVLVGMKEVKIDLTFGGEGDGLDARDFDGLQSVIYTACLEAYYEPIPTTPIPNARIEAYEHLKRQITVLKHVKSEWL